MSSQPRDGAVDGEHGGVSVDRLRRELPDDATPDGDDGRPAEILDAATTTLFTEGDVAFDEGTVRNNLDEILVALVALQDGGEHGKELMDDIETLFDADLSPGTVYPRLHELDDDGVFEVRELVRSKEYDLAAGGDARERVAASMHQHLVLGRFFRAALEEL